jgi:septum site-determining protein MinC
MLNTSPVLEFKSSTFFAPILILFKNDIAAIELALQEKVNLAPEFFKDSPLIIDLRELNKQNLDLDFIQIAGVLRNIGFFPVGIREAMSNKISKQAHYLSRSTQLANKLMQARRARHKSRKIPSLLFRSRKQLLSRS